MPNLIKISRDKRVIHVKFDGSTALDFAAAPISMPTVTLYALLQYSAAVNNTITIRDGSATGCPIFKCVDVTGGGALMYCDDLLVSPYVLGAEVTANVEMIFYLQGL